MERSARGGTAMPEKNLRVVDLAGKLQANEALSFLDVREEWEQSIYPSFPHAIKIPFSTMVSQWETLLPFKGKEIVVCCLFGWKSQEACRLLSGKGFEHVWNLQGGLEEWYLYEEQSGIEG